MKKTIIIFLSVVFILIAVAVPVTVSYGSSGETKLSNEIVEACNEIGEQWDICPELLMAIIEAESNGNQYVRNKMCLGLMQINTSNGEVYAVLAEYGYTDIWDVRANITLGCWVLTQKMNTYGDDIYAVLMAYNGTSDVSDRIATGDITDYALNVTARAEELERLHGK